RDGSERWTPPAVRAVSGPSDFGWLRSKCSAVSREISRHLCVSWSWFLCCFCFFWSHIAFIERTTKGRKIPRFIKDPSIIQAAGTKPKRIDTPHLVISGNSETWTPTLLECQATFPTTRLYGNQGQDSHAIGKHWATWRVISGRFIDSTLHMSP